MPQIHPPGNRWPPTRMSGTGNLLLTDPSVISLDLVFDIPFITVCAVPTCGNERVAAAGRHIKHRIATPFCLSLSLSLSLIYLISTIDLTAFSLRVSATLSFKRLHLLDCGNGCGSGTIVTLSVVTTLPALVCFMRSSYHWEKLLASNNNTHISDRQSIPQQSNLPLPDRRCIRRSAPTFAQANVPPEGAGVDKKKVLSHPYIFLKGFPSKITHKR